LAAKLFAIVKVDTKGETMKNTYLLCAMICLGSIPLVGYHSNLGVWEYFFKIGVWQWVATVAYMHAYFEAKERE
jgi:hypothetical protein